MYNRRPMKLWGAIAGLMAASIWGGMYVVSKVVLEVIPPFALLSIRLTLGAAVLGVVVLGKGGLRLSPRKVGSLLGVGLVGFGVSVGLQFVGTALSTAANASLVTSASPVFLLLFGALLLRERITLRRLAALVVASLGVLAVIDPQQARFDASMARGNLALIGASITWGLYSVLVRRASADVGTTQVSLVAFAGGLLLSVPLAFVEGAGHGIGRLTPAVVAGILYLGVVSTALAMYLWNKSLAILEAGAVSLLFFAQPLVGAGLGVALLGERLTQGFWLGAVLIGAGLLLSSWPAGSSPHPARQQEEG
jgi:drug/metabolite transporter (DMT)-like permease